ncbi:MAG: DUF5658 family protein [Chromatiales bacterium]
MNELVSSLEEYDGLKGVVAAVVVLNMLDGVLTIGWIEFGRAVELNPLMDYLLGTHPVLFIFIKMLLVCLGILLLWRLRARASAVISIYVCLAVYSSVLLYHLGGGVIQMH